MPAWIDAGVWGFARHSGGALRGHGVFQAPCGIAVCEMRFAPLGEGKRNDAIACLNSFGRLVHGVAWHIQAMCVSLHAGSKSP